ncbi:immunoglobulin-like domain-containing protein, partial [Hanstruepera ponticola]|uniref:immunoglobulin-like domain-containing protein n=1 Tax=Hanstruepera ponticola TaxID=2042995 RepID=UPI00177E32AD
MRKITFKLLIVSFLIIHSVGYSKVVYDSHHPTDANLTTIDSKSAINNFVSFNPYTEARALAIAVCQDISVNLDGSGSATIVAADIDNGSIGDGFSIDISSFSCTDVGTPVTVTLTVTQSLTGTSDTCTAQVTVLDSLIPTITLNGANPQTLEACGSYNELGAVANDNCAGVGAVVIDASAVNMNVPGSYTVTYNVDDAEGNSATQVTRTVNVVDTTDPTITLNGAATVTVEACGTYNELGATADDGCLAIGAVTVDNS